MKKTLGALALLGASAIVLAGCAGGSGDRSARPTEGAEIRVWLVGTDTPQEARDYLKTTFEEENPGSTLTIEEQTLGRPRRQADDEPLELGQPRRRRGRQHAGRRHSPRSARSSTSPTSTRRSAATTCSPASSRRARTTASSTPRRSTRARASSSTRPVRSSVRRLPPRSTSTSRRRRTLAAANPGKSGIYFPGQDWYNALPYIWENGGEIAVAGRRRVGRAAQLARVDRGSRSRCRTS